MSKTTRQDPDDNPQIPTTGISVDNNPDGTFAVSSAGHTFTIGTPTAQTKARPGRRGGIVVAGLVAGASLPRGTIHVRDTDELTRRLKSEVSAARMSRAAGHTGLTELHFSLKGKHRLDVSKLSEIAGGYSSPILAHIHIDSDDNPHIPMGG
jgi:hypothetical protein